MTRLRLFGKWILAPLAIASASPAHAVYWNLFNIEGESRLTAGYVTYATFDDMIHDTNALDTVFPDSMGRGANIIDGGYDGTRYWNLFNIEGESRLSAGYVSYATLADMLNDTNPIGTDFPDALGRGNNIVGSGYDGTRYWNLFNIEGESRLSAGYVTYATFDDMIHDTNAIDTIFPDSLGRGANIIDGGYDGTRYWNLFNIEGESRLSAGYVTYATFADMANDTNAIDTVFPDALGRGNNIIGSGTDSFPSLAVPGAVPEPAAWAMMVVGFGAVGLATRRSRKRAYAFRPA